MAENTKAAGRISGNPLNGLCERVCIQVKKVIDGCMTQYANEAYELAIDSVSPEGLVLPYTYVGVAAVGQGVVSNLTVTPPESTGGRSRVQFDAAQALSISLTDANGTSGKATASVRFHRDILLNLPSESIVPYSIDVSTGVMGRVGSFSADGKTCTVRLCVVQLVRVVTTAEILVPSYGYCAYPFCQEYAESICPGFFELPVFPVSE